MDVIYAFTVLTFAGVFDNFLAGVFGAGVFAGVFDNFLAGVFAGVLAGVFDNFLAGVFAFVFAGVFAGVLAGFFFTVLGVFGAAWIGSGNFPVELRVWRSWERRVRRIGVDISILTVDEAWNAARMKCEDYKSISV